MDVALPLALSAGSALVGTDPTNKKKVESNMTAVLQSRLHDFNTRLGDISPLKSHVESESFTNNPHQAYMERLTADMALWVVTQVQATEIKEQNHDRPTLGTRDLTQMRTLLAILFKWGIQRETDRVTEHMRASSSVVPPNVKTSIVEIQAEDDAESDRALLQKLTEQIIGLIFSLETPSVHGPVHQSHITQIIVTRHITPLLKACVLLAWASNSSEKALELRKIIDRLLSLLPVPQSLASLGSINSQLNFPPYNVACGRLLTQQLLSPGGVRGLCSSVLGEGIIGEAAPLQKLESIARILSTTPSNMATQTYYSLIIPRIMAILSPDDEAVQTPAPESHKRAAALSISRMLATKPGAASHVMSNGLLRPFGPPDLGSPVEQASATRSLQTLQDLLAHGDPTPTLPKYLLGSILPSLYALLAQLDSMRTADPSLKELVKGLLRAWVGTVDLNEAVNGWWNVLRSGGGWGERDDIIWHVVGEDVEVQLTTAALPSLSLLTPAERKVLDEADDEADALDLRPNPRHLVALLKTIDRKDVNSALLVRALDQYQALQASDEEPLKTMLYLKFVLEMVDQLGSTVLSNPEHILSFVSHALRSEGEKNADVVPGMKASVLASDTTSRDSLFIVEPKNAVKADDEEEDSDDESDNDLIETALNLLLAVLEANEKLTSMNTPLLQVIESDIEVLTTHASTTVGALAREARLVLTARNASTSTAGSQIGTGPEDPRQRAQEQYQQALKLLQDPILPVRAHGLVLLKNLVLSAKAPTPGSRSTVDPALIPAILSIFLQLVQEDDSYIFLNAVQGLVAMADTLGPEILKGLVDVYGGGLVDGAAGSHMTKAELDRRVRVGEALGQFIRKCGDTLNMHVNTLVPALFGLVRSRHLPTTLRTSALSLLAQCAEVSPLAMLPWSADLCSGVTDLVQLEGVSALPADMQPRKEATSTDDKPDTDHPVRPTPLEEMDVKPLSQDPKLAPLRRAGLHFISVLLRALVTSAQDAEPASLSSVPSLDASNFRMGRTSTKTTATMLREEYMPAVAVKHMRLVLGYARATDVDDVVRVMAGEVLELLSALQQQPSFA
ncbi:hypothetical protein FRB95_000765 [Tulasnella sp. JGI-2019a]|nr:hypothetical protein FRB95_000765 [Tulasnella sp. JGI-2019a]